ncbi:hypothetical protein TTRE_0000248801 [Trichuris trichiura]|uniref:mTERF domain containing protein n=1 Tax=Trichuris trichiura TaxID=36087 RepID=A0A077Z3J1_TRITR|nr:hypothetical protein TTRE_0000248801 [Trichuris trichiura]
MLRGFGRQSALIAISSFNLHRLRLATCSTDERVQRLFEEISDRLAAKGHTILPLRHSCQQNAICALAEQNMSDDEIIDIAASNAELLQMTNEEIISAIKLFALFGVSTAKAVRLTLAPESVHILLRHLTARGLSTKHFDTMLGKCSDVLNLTPARVDQTFDALLDFFSVKQCLFIVSHHPTVMLYQPDDLRSKYEFLHLNIGLSNSQVAQSRWFEHSLSKLELRFECACRCGAYEILDVRQQRQAHLAKHNPKLRDIIDTSDEAFARHVCHISMEEYRIFMLLLHASLLKRKITAFEKWKLSKVKETIFIGNNNFVDRKSNL